MRNPSFFEDSSEPAPETVDSGLAGIDPRQLAALLMAARANNGQDPAQNQASPAGGAQAAPTSPPAGLPGQLSPSPQMPNGASVVNSAQSDFVGRVPKFNFPKFVLDQPLATLGAPQQSIADQQSDFVGKIPKFGSKYDFTHLTALGRPQAPPAKSNFMTAMLDVIDRDEGGFQSNPDDKGNYVNGKLVGTKYGIAAKYHPDVDIKNLTKAQAAAIYQKNYDTFSSLTDQRVLTKVLSFAVNMQGGGNGAATRILQKAINASGGRVAVDGKFGPATAQAANAIDPDQLMRAMVAPARAYYASLKDYPKFKKTWDKRAERIPGSPEDVAERKTQAIQQAKKAWKSKNTAGSQSSAGGASAAKTASQAKAAAVKRAQEQKKKE
jgi:lysozyme family protein